MPCPTLCVTVQGVSNVSSTRKRLSPLRPFLLVTTKWIGSGTCLNLRSANSRECDRQLPAAALCSPASDRPWPFHSGTDSSTEKRSCLSQSQQDVLGQRGHTKNHPLSTTRSPLGNSLEVAVASF
eukprot:gene22459-28585_t